MTPQVVILVEGQTEEAFIQRVLQPYVGSEVFLQAVIVHTSRAADGSAHRGGGAWRNYDRMLRDLLGQRHWTMITTLIDFYGYPPGAPACSCRAGHDPVACAESREAAIRDSLPRDPRFVPFLMLHEFEAMVLAVGAINGSVLGDSKAGTAFRASVAEHNGNAELVNDRPKTAPSKRVAAELSDYRKVRDSVEVLQGQLPAALAAMPRLSSWVGLLRPEVVGIETRRRWVSQRLRPACRAGPSEARAPQHQ